MDERRGLRELTAGDLVGKTTAGRTGYFSSR